VLLTFIFKLGFIMTVSTIELGSEHKIQFLRISNVTDRTGLSRSAIYDRLNSASPRYDPLFPKPIRLGKGKNPPIAFVEYELAIWMEIQIMQSRRESNPGATK
jgi:prophage regulatory protein